MQALEREECRMQGGGGDVHAAICSTLLIAYLERTVLLSNDDRQ